MSYDYIMNEPIENMENLGARSVKIGYDKKVIVGNLDISFLRPEIVSIIGPNGSGKSTILKALGRILKPQQGTVLLKGKDIHSLPAKQVARMMSILPQGPQTPGDVTVKDLVAFGRSPYQGIFAKNSNDAQIIDWAISETNLEKLCQRQVSTLSGGERQRAWVAMALAQKTNLLLLDEPTTFLDIHHQFEVMELLERLYQRLGITIIMVIHDLNHAARFSHRVIAVKKGSICRDDTPDKVITEDVLKEVFRVKTKVMTINGNDGESITVCVPYGVYR